jgi:hypothetical protein
MGFGEGGRDKRHGNRSRSRVGNGSLMRWFTFGGLRPGRMTSRSWMDGYWSDRGAVWDREVRALIFIAFRAKGWILRHKLATALRTETSS